MLVNENRTDDAGLEAGDSREIIGRARQCWRSNYLPEEAIDLLFETGGTTPETIFENLRQIVISEAATPCRGR